MKREEALAVINANVTNQNLVKHMLAAETIMRAMARRFGEDEETWGLAGLLHDVDYDQTKDDPQLHSLKGSQMLAEMGVDPQICYAVKVHNEVHGDPMISRLDKALYAVDPLTGLITAGALIRPEKKLAAVTTQSIMKRFGEKSFARGANRDQIRTCSTLDLELEEFVSIGLEAMQSISDDLGL
jgi:putative nucleotidyltransferase with HDIG domain